MQVYVTVSIDIICCHENIANPNTSYRPIETITTGENKALHVYYNFWQYLLSIRLNNVATAH